MNMNTTTAQPMRFETPDQGEEVARADLYGLLAALFYAPPTPELLTAIAQAQYEGDGILQQAWSQLAVACAQADPQKVREEYDALFIGTGKPEVMLYGSYYLSGFLMEKPLAALRTDLADMGLERTESMSESEDHIAALCEVMRFLITAEDPVLAGIDTQKRFFSTHMQPWAETMCEQLMGHPQAGFYGAVASVAKVFFDVESQAFDMV